MHLSEVENSTDAEMVFLGLYISIDLVVLRKLESNNKNNTESPLFLVISIMRYILVLKAITFYIHPIFSLKRSHINVNSFYGTFFSKTDPKSTFS